LLHMRLMKTQDDQECGGLVSIIRKCLLAMKTANDAHHVATSCAGSVGEPATESLDTVPGPCRATSLPPVPGLPSGFLHRFNLAIPVPVPSPQRGHRLCGPAQPRQPSCHACKTASIRRLSAFLVRATDRELTGVMAMAGVIDDRKDFSRGTARIFQDDRGRNQMNDTTPTSEAYHPLQYAFDYFNRMLFNNGLPHCVLTLRHHRKSLGYFHAAQFSVDGNTTDEIALNAEMFALRTTKQTLSTVVHEMSHLWQQHFGKPSLDGHHNREWAGKMESIGLMPSDTGLPGGKMTGKRMTHYIVAGGSFDLVAEALLASGFQIKVTERPKGELAAKKKASKTKFTCPTCGANAWGRLELRIACVNCHAMMQAMLA
jgi:hypothetical protein